MAGAVIGFIWHCREYVFIHEEEDDDAEKKRCDNGWPYFFNDAGSQPQSVYALWDSEAINRLADPMSHSR